MRKLDWTSIGDSDVCLDNVLFQAGIRPLGRMVDYLDRGRPHHGLLYLFSGKEIFFDEKKRVILEAKAGDMVFLPSGARYQMRVAEEYTNFSLINFDMSLDGDALTLADGMEILVSDCYDGDLFALFHKAARACDQAESISVFRRKELIYRLFAYLSVSYSERFIPEGDSFLKIKPGVDLLRASYLENLPISQLAAVCNISISSFRTLFVERFGMPPVQYRNQLRIDRAKELLSDGDVTVSEVAEAMGFSSESYFCRCYKKMTGTTPTQRNPSFEKGDQS